MEEITEEPERQGSGPGQLSYSAGKMLYTCEWFHYLDKVRKVKSDTDINADTYALRFGTAVHYVMEQTKYDVDLYKKEMITQAILDERLEESDFYKVFACCRALFLESKASGLRIIVCERKISGESTFGYIDAIGIDSKGRWWIMDLKTTSWFQSLLPLRLSRDPQLSVYASHKEDIAIELGLDSFMFGGVVFRVVTKPKSQPKEGETLTAYAARVKCVARSVIIPAAYLDAEGVLAEHKKNRDRSEKIKSGEIPESEIRRNYNACTDYNKACKFWSYCYKRSYTDCLNQIVVSEPDNLVDVSTVEPKATIQEEEDEMLNIKCLGTQVFNQNRVRVDMAIAMGMAEFTRPYYYDATTEVDANAINGFITEASTQAKLDFWAHLAALADSKIYQSWANKLGVAAVPATTAAAKEDKVIVVAPPPVPAKEEKPAPAPAKEEEPAPAPAKEEKKPAPAKAKAPAAKKEDVKVYEKGVPENSAALKAEVAKAYGEGWTADAAKKAKVNALAAKLAEDKVVIFRSGELAQEFVEYVAAYLAPEEDCDL